ncbi:MAG: response regulator [Candidatus Krumholzibacteriia bacterium]
MAGQKILWVDDEIEHLKSHVRFLQGKGYEVSEATNGEDALDLVKKQKFDVLLLDESMPGMGGLETLNEIKEIDPALQVVMITKNEEERLMDDAIGMKISDYLLKPVSPVQIHSACKRILDSHRLQESRFSQDYVKEFNNMNSLIDEGTWESWLRAHRKLSEWDLEFDRFRDSGLESTHDEQKLNANKHFSRFMETQYPEWLHSEHRPPLSVDVFKRFVAPHIIAGEQVVFIVIDCVRLDQWMIVEEILGEHFNVRRDYYLSILPTATPYSRNAIFSGLFPDEIAQKYPGKWTEKSKNETSKNRYEEFFLREQLRRHSLGSGRLKYIKIYAVQEANELGKRIDALLSLPLVAMVFNFVDMLTHGRNQSEILQQVAPDEAAFRSVVRSWFSHSVLLDILKHAARKNIKVVMTTDHGSILGRRASLVYGRRDTSTNLRYKYGDNLKCDEKQAIITRKPAEFRLPAESKTKTYLFAKEYFYFVYPTNYRDYEKQYQGSFQHGGVSLEEMILPCLTLLPRA